MRTFVKITLAAVILALLAGCAGEARRGLAEAFAPKYNETAVAVEKLKHEHGIVVGISSAWWAQSKYELNARSTSGHPYRCFFAARSYYPSSQSSRTYAVLCDSKNSGPIDLEDFLRVVEANESYTNVISEELLYGPRQVSYQDILGRTWKGAEMRFRVHGVGLKGPFSEDRVNLALLVPFDTSKVINLRYWENAVFKNGTMPTDPFTLGRKPLDLIRPASSQQVSK